MRGSRGVVALLVASALAAAPAAAQSRYDQAVESVRSQLDAQGYTVSDVGRTLLGHVRVTARKEDRRRELVFDLRTGEVLRDVVTGDRGRRGLPQIFGGDANDAEDRADDREDAREDREDERDDRDDERDDERDDDEREDRRDDREDARDDERDDREDAREDRRDDDDD